jgi:hypothetical protein
MTERSDVRFAVAEGDRPSVAIEIVGDDMKLPGLRFELRGGSTFDDAQNVARYLNAWVSGMTVTRVTTQLAAFTYASL